MGKDNLSIKTVTKRSIENKAKNGSWFPNLKKCISQSYTAVIVTSTTGIINSLYQIKE